MNAKAALSKIQQEINAPKDKTNTFGKYKYRNLEGILAAAKKVMPAESYITLSDDVVLIGDRYYIKATATFVFGDESVSAFGVARESVDKKGMDLSQLTGATSSYARKYAAAGLFAIDDEDDADTYIPERSTAAIPAQKAERSNTISAAQLKRLQTIASIHKVPIDKVKEIIKRVAGVDSSKDIGWKDYEAVCNEIEGK